MMYVMAALIEEKLPRFLDGMEWDVVTIVNRLNEHQRGAANGSAPFLRSIMAVRWVRDRCGLFRGKISNFFKN